MFESPFKFLVCCPGVRPRGFGGFYKKVKILNYFIKFWCLKELQTCVLHTFFERKLNQTNGF